MALKEMKKTLREFLDNSSIHGLNYISNAKFSLERVAWICAVGVGFIMGTTLIQISFEGWNESPFITTTSMKPISQAPFPIVTICPPMKTNTAVNYDIMRSSNVSLNDSIRSELYQKSKQLVYESLFKNHVKENRNWASTEDIIQSIYAGNLELDENIINGKWNFHSDMNSQSNAMTIKATGMEGYIYTPRFFDKLDKDRYDNSFRFTYEITVSHIIPEGGTIQMNLTLDTKESINLPSFNWDLT